ncbi:MAG: quinone oxidoreductase [Steroidobacteraceae bacterium]|jgi:NADPH2:quinone reductase|nr:quinone oxidoreductase [Steroidobacteraceae bacterium]
MINGVRIRQHGGPEVLKLEPVDVGPTGRGEVRVRHTAIGLNFIDVYDRTGLYPMTLPATLGREAAGVVTEVGRGVRGLREGDRVAYVLHVPGAYVEERVVPADRMVKVPPQVSDEQAAAAMLKGLTAQYLLRSTYRVKRGDPVVIHAAAGGVGLIAVQWARHLGAEVIAVTGSGEKAELAREHGAHHTILLGRADLAARVREITGGRGVPVVYDSVGRDTFTASLDCLRPRGLMVSYGNASGPVPPFAPLELSRRGSLYLTRPTLFHYIATRRELERAAAELFEVMGSGAVKIRIGQTFSLADAAVAHRELEARRTTGSTVLVP